jgi:LysM repeat protein
MITELIFVGVSLFHPHPVDSIGVETVNGKVFVVHKVDDKETLYSIARRYGASVDAIRSSNPELTSTLEVGQIIKVPYTPKSKSSAPTASGRTHKVAPKETMYSISRSYGVSVDDLKKWNNLTDNSLSVGQELIVQKPSQSSARNTEVKSTAAPSNDAAPGRTHTVATKETLFSIARQYKVSVAQIRSWNSLQSDELQVGQTIYVSAPGERKETQSSTVAVSQPKETRTETQPTTTSIETTTARTETQPSRTDQPATQKTEPVASTTKSQTIRISESLKNSDEITEAGIAELIEGTDGNRKYLALHRTAPVGTILKVRNEMNNREVFVRVMGKLPDTTLNDKLIIKISRSAYDRLGAIDPRFRVELTYYK